MSSIIENLLGKSYLYQGIGACLLNLLRSSQTCGNRGVEHPGYGSMCQNLQTHVYLFDEDIPTDRPSEVNITNIRGSITPYFI